MDVRIEESWKNRLQTEFDKPYFKSLSDFIRLEYQNKQIFPPARLIFNAFDSCPFDQVKVVIIGQDPYHNEGEAHGLCFSVPDGVRIPPSLQNIFKEIQLSLGIEPPKSGNLMRWAKQGVLLLNATLTVEANRAGSHQQRGWEEFTDSLIRILADEKDNLVFMLWGAYAQKKASFVDTKKHLILKSVHPSPLAAYRGFFGNKHFVKANEYLVSKNISTINW